MNKFAHIRVNNCHSVNNSIPLDHSFQWEKNLYFYCVVPGRYALQKQEVSQQFTKISKG
jgi:hypothetical protein